ILITVPPPDVPLLTFNVVQVSGEGAFGGHPELNGARTEISAKLVGSKTAQGRRVFNISLPILPRPTFWKHCMAIFIKKRQRQGLALLFECLIGFIIFEILFQRMSRTLNTKRHASLINGE